MRHRKRPHTVPVVLALLVAEVGPAGARARRAEAAAAGKGVAVAAAIRAALACGPARRLAGPRCKAPRAWAPAFVVHAPRRACRSHLYLNLSARTRALLPCSCRMLRSPQRCCGPAKRCQCSQSSQ